MNPRFYYDEIIIGGDLNAFFYSYKNNIPLVINRLQEPYRFQPEKQKLWNKLYFLLSLSGLNVIGDKSSTIRIDEEQLIITTKELRVAKLQFNKLVVFDDQLISGLPIASKEENMFMVVDWMIAKSCMPHNKKEILTNDSFVKEIHFYPTERTDGHYENIRDLMVVSYLTGEEIKDFDNSDVYARIKTEKLLKENGLTGKKNGVQRGKPINYNLELKVEKRELRKLKMDVYKDTENIEFKYADEIQEGISLSKYASWLNEELRAI